MEIALWRGNRINPRDHPMQHIEVQPVEVGPPGQRPVVLVADDSADMRGLLREVLEGAGYEVIAVASGGRALAEMGERRPHVVITDLFMPGMSGFTLRSQMLRRHELTRIPVIVLSAYWQRPSETLEAVDVLRKPLNVNRLLESVRRAIDGGT